MAEGFWQGLSAASLSAAGLTWAHVWLNLRQSSRADQDGVTTRTSKLFDQLQAELARAAKQSADMAAQIERLNEARMALDDLLTTVRDQAVAARIMVHELQRKLGVPETEFPELPKLSLAIRAPLAA